MAHANLVTPATLNRYGVPAAFLTQFEPRAIQIKISTAGALGTMAFQWRVVGEDNYDPTPIQSSAGATWACDLSRPNTYAALTFGAGSYTANATAIVSESGTVTTSGTWPATPTATRYDLRETACSSATAEAIGLMRDGVTLPLTAWGDDIKRHTASIAHEFLRASVGMTSDGAGQGDQNVLTWAAAARAYFGDIGASKISPPDLVDSATSEDGPILPSYPTSGDETARGW